jgi:hypothetical protein
MTGVRQTVNANDSKRGFDSKSYLSLSVKNPPVSLVLNVICGVVCSRAIDLNP